MPYKSPSRSHHRNCLPSPPLIPKKPAMEARIRAAAAIAALCMLLIAVWEAGGCQFEFCKCYRLSAVTCRRAVGVHALLHRTRLQAHPGRRAGWPVAWTPSAALIRLEPFMSLILLAMNNAAIYALVFLWTPRKEKNICSDYFVFALHCTVEDDSPACVCVGLKREAELPKPLFQFSLFGNLAGCLAVCWEIV
jgi:hypothetical protein